MNASRLKRTSLLKASLVVAAVLLAVLVGALSAITKPVEAAFPGKNGKIAFSSYRDGHVQQSNWPSAEIYVMDADGSNPVNITNDPGSDDSSPTWSPDGTKLAFVSRRRGSALRVRVYIMNADGSGVRHVSDALDNTGHLIWSPDGSKLAFSSNHDIWVMKANSSGQTNITADSGFYSHSWPTWSPDGAKIAFMGLPKDEGYYGDIYVMDADGSNITSLTNDRDIPDHLPEWSPDGNKIAFTSVRDNGYGDIYVMDTDGSDVTRLTRYPGDDWDLEWSPDGSKITFQRYRFVDDILVSHIYVMNADGSNKNKVSPDTPEMHHYYRDSAWSPDGSKITFTGRRVGDDVGQFGNGADEIYTVNADGSNPANITNNPADDSEPDWQPLTGPTTKADCRDGGYMEFGFKNQGRCIVLVNRATRSE